MGSAREFLALRKEVLVARASLQRLKIGVELDALREDLRWPRFAVAIAASPPGRSALLGALLLVAGRGRATRLIRIAAGALALAKLASTLTRLARRPGPEGGAGGEPGPKPSTV